MTEWHDPGCALTIEPSRETLTLTDSIYGNEINGSLDPRHNQDARLWYSPRKNRTYLVELSSIAMMECSN
eukprot:scaffold30608_cov137-Amphora_coffeaeformis.AAC.1